MLHERNFKISASAERDTDQTSPERIQSAETVEERAAALKQYLQEHKEEASAAHAQAAASIREGNYDAVTEQVAQSVSKHAVAAAAVIRRKPLTTASSIQPVKTAKSKRRSALLTKISSYCRGALRSLTSRLGGAN
jgi:hypothetical protein